MGVWRYQFTQTVTILQCIVNFPTQSHPPELKPIYGQMWGTDFLGKTWQSQVPCEDHGCTHKRAGAKQTYLTIS